MALSAESAGVFHDAGIDVLYTGVGKVNAAIALTRRLAHLRHEGLGAPLVVNFGTAGSARIPARTLVACRKFVDRDMNVGALGFAPGVTPYDELPPVLEFPVVFPGLPEAGCGSGDAFATTDHGPTFDVVDMESYALATDAGFRVLHSGVLIDLGIARGFRCLGEAPRSVIRYGG